MPEQKGPQVYSIAAHRGFADALAAGLLPRYSEGDFGLARLTLLLPSQRAARSVTEAFVRLLGDAGGLLLPRMVVVGDLDLDEALGPLFDPLGTAAEIPPAADPLQRWFRLAQILADLPRERGLKGAALMRQALGVGQTMDRLLVEGIAPGDLLAEPVVGLVKDQAVHWEAATREFLTVQAHWLADLEGRGEVDAPTRRNRLFDHAAQTWRDNPPAHPVVAAGVTSASPALARLLRVVSELPRGAVILPDLDITLDQSAWDELGRAGMADAPGDAPFGPGDAITHPQYHLKLLLGRMGVARGEVQAWHRSGASAAPPARSRAISSLFLPPRASASWASLPADQRRLAGVRVMESANPAEESQAIAVLMRGALEVPGRRVALVTPDRELAARVIAQLGRWGIEADDTAGQPLPLTAAGRIMLLLAEVMAQAGAPVPLVALLGHPLVRAGDGRAAWLEGLRRLDLALRGPRPDAGLEGLATRIAAQEDEALGLWWGEAAGLLEPVFAATDGDLPIADLLGLLAGVAEALCGLALWSRPDGRALAGFIETLRAAASAVPVSLPLRDAPAFLRDAMERVAVRPPWGGHPRVAVYGLLEARMARADLVICGALHEGSWPAVPAVDPLLPPAVLRALGVPGADFRIGLAAHDLAAALGAPEVVLSHAARDASGPVIPSRFVMRMKALLGRKLLEEEHSEREAVHCARALLRAQPAPPYARPMPMPSAEQRKVEISATGLDRLRSDPYQFYAGKILQLSALDGLDGDADAALRGTMIHAVLDRWHREGSDPARLPILADDMLTSLSAHPLMRCLWRPRLMQALEWVAQRVATMAAEGRQVALSEAWGSIVVKGVKVHGRADRIDRLPGGELAVIDYKSGSVPSNRMVQDGYSLQLGLLGLIARDSGFAEKGGPVLQGEPERFEYWSLGRSKDGFGFIQEPVRDPGSRKVTGPMREEFLDLTEKFLHDALDKWIVGSEPFTARLNPDVASYADYDQLMRLDEWQARSDAEAGDAA